MKKHLFLSLFMALFSSIQAQQSLDSLRLVLPSQSFKEIISCDISADGKYILTYGHNRIIQVWDALNVKKIQNIDAKEGSNFAKFSPDNKYILTCSPFGNVSLFNVKSSEQIWQNKINKYVLNIGFSNHGNSIFIELDNELIILNSLDGEIQQKLATNENSHILIEENEELMILNIEESIIRLNQLGNDSNYIQIRGNFKDVRSAYLSKKEKSLLTLDSNEIVRIYNLNSKKQICSFQLPYNFLSAKIGWEKKIIVTTGCDSICCVYNLLNGELIKKIKFEEDCIASFSINRDNNKIVFGLFDSDSWKAECWLYSIETDELINCNNSSRAEVAFSPKGNLFLQGNSIFEVKSGKRLKNFQNDVGTSISSIFFSNEDSIVICENFDYNFIKFNFYSGICNTYDGNYNKKINGMDSLDSNYFIGMEQGDFYLLNKETNQKVMIQEIHQIQDGCRIYFLKLVNNDSMVLTTWSNGLIEIWDVNTGVTKYQINCKTPAIEADISKDLKYLVVLNEEQISMYSINGDLIYERIQLENNNWLIKLPNSPYYMCSKDASKMLHYVTPSLKVIGFEQLDPVYNRPDIVLDSIGKYFDNEDGGMIEEYRKSWEKRIHKLGLDVDKLGKGEIAVPSAEIVGADDIAYENKDGKLRINISATDAKYPLRRFNVFVNEVPLYGSAGISIAHLNKQIWDTTVTIPLSHGENKIQVSVMNELGLENFKYPAYVNYIPENNGEIVARTHYIGIGVNEFIQKENNLKFCVDDVTDLAEAFSGKNSKIKLYTNQNVTRENILKLKQYLHDSTTVNDKVIISCSSHGLLDDSLNFYLATYDVDFKNPEQRGLRYEELESLLDGIPARQKLLLLDACNSGENDKTEPIVQELSSLTEEVTTQKDMAKDKSVKGVKVKSKLENQAQFMKMNELFVNVRNNTGSVIISAAGGQQSALEGEGVQVDGKGISNGAFTYCVLEYLKQHEGDEKALTVVQLKQYVEKRVEEITKGQQKPTSRQETMEIDWGLR